VFAPRPGKAGLAHVSIAFAACMIASSPAAAQSDGVERRIDRLESEMRAVQRKVFPGGDTRYFEPEFAPAPQEVQPTGIPSTTPLADLTQRVDALERQLATLTGQAERNGHEVQQLRDELRRFREDAEFRLAAIEDGEPQRPRPPGGVAAATPPTGATPAPTGAAASPPAAAPSGAPQPLQTAEGSPASPPPVGAEAPAPADPVEAEYLAAYQLFQARDYPKAESALQAFVSKHPKSPRSSHAQFWLGRTYAAQNSNAQAAKAFLDNYRTLPRGERAPDSLLWLGKSLQKLGQPSEACRAYNELQAAYGTKLSEGFRSDLAQARTASKCEA
jgi:tol-pal system protein YbgF